MRRDEMIRDVSEEKRREEKRIEEERNKVRLDKMK